jgi:hypothetical protein
MPNRHHHQRANDAVTRTDCSGCGPYRGVFGRHHPDCDRAANIGAAPSKSQQTRNAKQSDHATVHETVPTWHQDAAADSLGAISATQMHALWHSDAALR